jgi:hypothetical protein
MFGLMPRRIERKVSPFHHFNLMAGSSSSAARLPVKHSCDETSKPADICWCSLLVNGILF